MSIQKEFFGTLESGAEAHLYTLKNEKGVTVRITDFGGTVVSLLAPDRYGRFTDVVGGFDCLWDYEHADGYLGALVGPFANRIAKGTFSLDGVDYSLYCQSDGNHLHGGRVGFSHRLWNVVDASEADDPEPELVLTIASPDGDEGYPGDVGVTVTYRLTADSALEIHYEAAVEGKATPLNLTNHTYFNLAGYASGDVLGHVLQMDAESYLRTDEGLIPTGEMVPVAGTPFDFRTPKTIGQDFYADDNDLKIAGGYDHCFNFTGWQNTDDRQIKKRVTVYEPRRGRKLEVYTNQPCIQFYSANFLKNPEFPQKGGYPQRTQTAFCLETQKMPDSMNHETFPDCVVRPGQVYDYTTIYRFSAE